MQMVYETLYLAKAKEVTTSKMGYTLDRFECSTGIGTVDSNIDLTSRRENLTSLRLTTLLQRFVVSTPFATAGGLAELQGIHKDSEQILYLFLHHGHPAAYLTA